MQQSGGSLDALKILVPLLAAILGSLVTLVANHFYTRWRERKAKREQIFRTLMSTRGFKLYQSHVDALCAVEIEWTGANDGEVRSAWKAYNHHLQKEFPEDLKDPLNVAWRNTLDDLFADLMVALGASVGKPVDRTDVKTGTYGPRIWWEIQAETNLLRKGLLGLIGCVIQNGKLAIPVTVQYDPMAQEQLERLKSAMSQAVVLPQAPSKSISQTKA